MKAHIHAIVTGATREKLEELLQEIGCEIVDDLENDSVEVDGAAAEAEDGGDCEEEGDQIAPACIVVLTPGLSEGDLQPGLGEAVRHGCRVIGVWGPGSDGDVSPLADYGADTAPWDSGRIRDAICGKPQHQNPDGAPAPLPDVTTGGC